MLEAITQDQLISGGSSYSGKKSPLLFAADFKLRAGCAALYSRGAGGGHAAIGQQPAEQSFEPKK